MIPFNPLLFVSGPGILVWIAPMRIKSVLQGSIVSANHKEKCRIVSS